MFIFGNPPYLGCAWRNSEQKEDMALAFHGYDDYKSLDYISCWFYKSYVYIKNTGAECALVSTNSITQGGQVAVLWNKILKGSVCIRFAYTSFKWSNNARHNAGVTCVIIGLTSNLNCAKYLYQSEKKVGARNINGYLFDMGNITINKKSFPISQIPEIVKGSMPNDNGFLILSEQEKLELIEAYPKSADFIKPLLGSSELINSTIRYCLWICDDEVNEACKIPDIKERVFKCKQSREKSNRLATRKVAEKPWAFGEIRYVDAPFVLIPEVSSERRIYVPIGYFPKGVVINNKAFAIYNGGIYVFGLVSSLLHMIWMKTVCGKLETRYSYSSVLCYNTFPFPKISDSKKREIEEAAEEVLLIREDYPGKTLAELYDPDKMPDDLREAHHRLDLIVESCYQDKPFANDEERLECLFRLYEKMTKKL